MNKAQYGLWRTAVFLIIAGLAFAPQALGANQKEGKTAFLVRFQPGAMNPADEAEVKKAAIYAVEKGKMLQVEGYSCKEDGDGGGKPTHRLEQGEKRAEAVRALLIKMGVPPDNVFTIAYDHGECMAAITGY